MSFLEGLTEVLGRLDLATAAMAGPAATETTKRVAEQVAADAAQLAPVATGALRNSIEAHTSGVAEAEVVATVDYAAFVEFGTSDTPAHPFLRPALHRNEGALEATARPVYRGSVPGLE